MQGLTILGRQPALGLAELESLVGSAQVQPVGSHAALLDVDLCSFDFSVLGGSIKLCKVLTTLDTTDWQSIEDFLVTTAPQHVTQMPEGKMYLGLSTYGLTVNAARITATGLAVKKAIRATGRPVRLIPNKSTALNSAQVLHNHLTSSNGWELVFVRSGNQTIVAQTLFEQDIEAYAARDQARPKRDSRVGMLPPKLAQIIVNLAVGHTPASHLLDPFCGTGVVLQEALLMGHGIMGTDIEPRMIDYTRTNLEWLSSRHSLPHISHPLSVADATTHAWPPFDTIAAETYLGRPFSAQPTRQVLTAVIRDVDTIHKKFLHNVARQTKPGFRMCIAVPSWKTDRGFIHLPIIDQLTDLGYNRIDFEHARRDELIYHREGQIVGRELLVLERN